jgi:dTDP-4-amino-4,6-dideoxygalactose transaminase
VQPQVPFLNLGAQAKALGTELQAGVAEVLASGRYILGPAVESFESAFAASCGTPHAVAVSSGTAALQLALLALGVGPGDEVITVPMTFVATVAAIQYVGARAVLVDIDGDTGTMDPAAVKAAITPRTRAIMPVHLHGRMAAMDAIMTIARRQGLAVIEDAAQAHAATYHGRTAGSIGDLGCFSFYPGKNLGACGEGGAVVTSDAALAHRVRMLRDWGQETKYIHALKGFNYRMDAVQGRVLDIKLRHLDAWTAARRAIARTYETFLSALPARIPPPALPGEHVYHVYAIRARNRDGLCAALGHAGIATNIHYPVPVHLQPAYADLGYVRGCFPESEAFASETLSLPIYPEMTDAQVQRVCSALGELLQESHAQVA